MPRRYMLNQNTVEALRRAGVAEPERFLQGAILRASRYRTHLTNPKYGASYKYTLAAMRYAQSLEQWLAAHGFPTLTVLPAPSNGLRHSLYIDKRRSPLTLHINGVDYDAI